MNPFDFMQRHQRQFWLYAGLAAFGLAVLTTFAAELNSHSFGIAQLLVSCGVFFFWSQLVYQESGKGLSEPKPEVKARSSQAFFLYALALSLVFQILVLIVTVIAAYILKPDLADTFRILIIAIIVAVVLAPPYIILTAPIMLALPGRALGYGTTIGESARLSQNRRTTIVIVLLIGGFFSLLGSGVGFGLLVLGNNSVAFTILASAISNLIANIGILYVADRLTHLYVAAVQANRTAATA